MSLFFRSCLWRRGPFLDLRIPQASSNLVPAASRSRSGESPTLSPFNLLRKLATQNIRQPKPTVNTRAPRQLLTDEYISSRTTAYARLLAARRSPTILYQAPTAWTYPFACLTVGGFAIAYGFYNYYDIFLTPHPDLVWFVPWMFLAAIAFTFVFGLYFILNGSRLVKTISAVPPGPLGNPHQMMIRVQMRSLIGRSNTYVVPLEDVGLENSTQELRIESQEIQDEMIYPATEEGRRRASLERRKQERQSERDSMSNPVTHAWRGVSSLFGRLFLGTRRVLTREGFATLTLRKTPNSSARRWGIDVRDGWLLDGGIALDKLLLRDE